MSGFTRHNRTLSEQTVDDQADALSFDMVGCIAGDADILFMKKVRTWILIADGARARILLNEGPGKGVHPLPNAEYATESPPTRDIGTDRPGRVNDSFGGGRHAMEPRVDFHRQQKTLFVKEMAKKIDEAALGDSFDRLVLIAPPQALGDLREALGKHARDRVTAEMAKDLTGTPLNDLPKHLSDVLPV